MFIDETVAKPPSEFAAVCVAIVDDPLHTQAELDKARDRLLLDPYFKQIPTVQGSLTTDGFHYSQDTIDVRGEAIETLQQLPFEAYIAFSDHVVPDPDYAWYDALLAKILPNCLAENAHFKCRVIAEVHGSPHIRLQRLRSLVSKIVVELERRSGTRFASAPTVELGDKAQSCLAIADYAVGSFREFWLKGRHSEASIEARQFRELWSRIRVVLDTSTGTRYWRNNPLPGFE